MNNSLIAKEFEKLVKNKFNVYNSLFLNLPYPNISNVGMLIPIMHNVFKEGLENGKDPMETIDYFFATHTNITAEKEKIDFMFKVIHYVERQVVLYDSVEDAAFPRIKKLDNNPSLKDYINVPGSMDTREDLIQKLSSFSTRIVFTAHPTQFYPPSVLDIIAKLKTLISQNDINEIEIKLKQLGLTSLLNAKKPTPFDEAKNIIYFLRNVYYNAVGELYTKIKKSVKNRNYDNPQIIQFGFWPGGDRDGNPFVTSKITMAVANELRMNLMKCYYDDVKVLQKQLTFRKVEHIISKVRDKLYKAMFDPNQILSFVDIINPLLKIREIILQHYDGIYLEELDKFIDKVKIFKTHFAALDIRQHHNVHKTAVETILKSNKLIDDSIDDVAAGILVPLLVSQKVNISNITFDDDIVNDTIQNIIQLNEIQKRNGEEGCNRYIISNSEDIYSVLFVYALLRWYGREHGNIPFDIIPLFESMEGMKNSESIMSELFSIPEYRNHVFHREDTQTIMLGFSDGTKDGGYLKANWSIFKTKENLTRVCKQNDIKAIFFDGRGGPPARGGGKTHKFYAAQTDKIANHAIQLTIQGQTITSRYGTREHFIFNVEQLITAGLSNCLSNQKHSISDKNRQLIERLATISFDKYMALKNHGMFMPYLEDKSTLKYYSAANIGSRPSKRGTKEKLELSDLRAIPFVGSWSQLKQNVPGYFGVGTALKTLVDEGKLGELQALFSDVPFFKTLMLNSMMSLSKSYFELTAYIAKEEKYKEFWHILNDEYSLSKEMILLISQYSSLLEKSVTTVNSIKIREQIVLPLLVIQQYALQKIETNSDYKAEYEKIVMRSLYGNINASRNSA